MVLYASWDRSDPFLRRIMAARRALVLDSGAAAYLAATPFFLYPDWWINENEGLLREREKNALPGFPGAEIAASRIAAVLAFDRTADLHRITTPTLVLCANDDFLTPPYMSQALVDAIPGARSERLQHGGHACSEVSPREFEQRVLTFIEGCVARRTS